MSISLSGLFVIVLIACRYFPDVQIKVLPWIYSAFKVRFKERQALCDYYAWCLILSAFVRSITKEIYIIYFSKSFLIFNNIISVIL